MEYVLLQSFSNYLDAHMLMGRMEQENIQCWLKDEYTVTIDPILTNAVGGIKLMVAKEQFPRAKALLEQFEQERKSKRSCPRCGSHDIEQVHSPRKAVTWITAITSWLMGSYALGTDLVYHCFHCGAEFKEAVDNSEL